MAQVLVEEQSLSDTAAAIRSRLGGQDTYKPREFAAAINSIVDYATVTQTLTGASSSTNATKVAKGDSFYAEITPSESNYKITSVTVTMGGTDITSQVFKPGVGTKAITANGTYSAASDNLSGYDTVTVAVPSSAANLGTKSITENGTYAASSDSLDGYSEVTVNVSGGATPTMQTKNVSYTPTASTQTETVTADTGYDGLQNVGITVNPIPSQYIVPSGSQTITANNTYDVTNLSEVVVNVPSGGGSSGGLANMVDVNTQDYQFAYMLMAMKKGDTAGGTVTYTSAFTQAEQLILSTGLTTLHGFMFVGTSQDIKVNTGSTQCCKYVFVTINSDGTFNAVGAISSATSSGNVRQVLKLAQGTADNAAPLNGALRFSGGDIYYAARYNKNASYQIVAPNKQYEWLAW